MPRFAAIVFSVLVPAFAFLHPDEKLPLTIEADHTRFTCGWRLSVESTGEATLLIRRRLQVSDDLLALSKEEELAAVKKAIEERHTRRSFLVPSEHLESIRQIVMRERFFDLDDHYGEYFLDGPRRTVTISLGNRSKSVSFESITTDTIKTSSPEKGREIERVLQVWLAVSDLFDDERDDDLRKYYRSLLGH